MQEFKQKFKKDISDDQQAFCRPQISCERAKSALSSSTQASIDTDFLLDKVDFCTRITRACLKNLNKDLLRNALCLVQKALKNAKMHKTQTYDIVIVGGSCYILLHSRNSFRSTSMANKRANPSIRWSDCLWCSGTGCYLFPGQVGSSGC